MTKKLLSIITINYNNDYGVKKTMNSVFSQSFKDFEYIVIDGNSTDKSVYYIKEREKELSFWLSEDDKGIYNAMNKGIKISKGNYLLFLNSGDTLNGANALENFINHKNFKGDIIYGNYKFKKGEKKYPSELSPYFFFKSSLPHQSTFFKKSIFTSMGFYNENYKIGADRDFYIKCFLSGNFIFSHIPIALSNFDLTGVSNSNNFLKTKEDKQILKNYYKEFYEDYKMMVFFETELNKLKRNKIIFFLKKIKIKLTNYVK